MAAKVDEVAGVEAAGSARDLRPAAPQRSADLEAEAFWQPLAGEAAAVAAQRPQEPAGEAGVPAEAEAPR